MGEHGAWGARGRGHPRVRRDRGREVAAVAPVTALVVGLTIALMTGLTTGCSGLKPGRKPEATFESVRKAMLEKKYEALWGLLSPKSREFEIDKVRRKQRDVEVELDNMTAADKAGFLRRRGVSPEMFVNMSPAELFAVDMRRASRLATGLEEALAAAEVTGVRADGDTATLEVTVRPKAERAPGEKETVSLTLEREYGLYRVRSFDDLLAAFRPVERTRRPGRTPKETYEAFRACVRDRAYRDLWDLFSPFMREKLAEAMEKLKEEFRGLSASERRSRERDLGRTVEEFLAMPPEAAFAAKMRFSIQVQKRLPPMLLGKFVSAEVAGEKATILLKGRRGEYRIPMVREGGVWLLEGL